MKVKELKPIINRLMNPVVEVSDDTTIEEALTVFEKE